MRTQTYLTPGGSPERGVKILLGTLVAALGIFVFWGSPAYPDALGLVPAKALGGGQVWRVLTAPLWFGTLDKVRIAPFVLALIGLYFLGTPLERWLGTRRFLALFGASALSGHLGAALVGLGVRPDEALGGPAPGMWGVAAALCINYWNLSLFVVRPLPVRGKHLFYGLAAALVIALFVDLADHLSWLPFLADALGGAVGAAFVTRGWRLWSRGPRSRSRFVVLQGGRVGDHGHRKGGGGPGKNGGNGRSKGDMGGRPKYWN